MEFQLDINKLPAGCSAEIIEIFSSSENSKEFSSRISAHSELFIEIFRRISSHPGWTETHTFHFNDLIFQISKISANDDLTREQIKTVLTVSTIALKIINRTYFTGFHQSLWKNLAIEAHQRILTTDTALDFILHSDEKTPKELLDNCTCFLSQRDALTFERRWPGIFIIKIHKESEVADKLVNIDEPMRSKMIVTLDPPEKTAPFTLSNLISKYGASTERLILKNNILNDSHLKNLLDQCPHLKSLYIESHNIRVLQSLPASLEQLICTNSPMLAQVVSLPDSLKDLEITHASIQELPMLPSNLTYLNCDDCKNLEKFPELPKSLDRFSCKGCDKITLEKKLETLFSMFKISELAAFNIGRTLAFTDDHLLFITHLARSKDLVGVRPEQIKPLLGYLPLGYKNNHDIFLNLINLIKFNLILRLPQAAPSHNRVIAVLSDKNLFNEYPEAARETFRDLNQFRKLITLDTSELAQCDPEEIEALIRTSVGKALVRYYQNEFFKYRMLREIICNIWPPEEISNFDLYFSAKMHQRIVYLNFLPTILFKQPDAVLKALFKFPTIKRINVLHFGSPGIDDGGLSKQLFSQLTLAIVNKSQLLKFSEFNNKGMRPTAQVSRCDTETAQHYRRFGKFLGLAFRTGSPIGNLLTMEFFNCMFSFSWEQLLPPVRPVDHLLSQRSTESLMTFTREQYGIDTYRKDFFTQIEKVLSSDDSEEIKLNAEKIYDAIDDDDLNEAIQANDLQKIQSIVRNYLIEELSSYLQIAYFIAQGFASELPFWVEDKYYTSWKALTASQPAKTIARQLQGSLSVDFIKQNLLFDPIDSLAGQNICSWTEEWLEENRENKTGLSNWMMTLTGSSALLSQINFIISDSDNLDSVYPHTCFDEVDIPISIDEDGLKATFDSYARGEHLEFTTE